MKGFRTLAFNLLAVILPILETADLTDVLGAEGMSIYGMIIAFANILLRSVTTTKVLKAE